MSSGMPGANGPAGPNYDDKPAIRNTLRTRDDDTEFTEVTLARSNRPEAAPKNTPSEIVDRLNKEINAVFADPKFKARPAPAGSNDIIPCAASPMCSPIRNPVCRPAESDGDCD